MKVFISWSGDASRRIATALFEWLPMVLQSTKPYMSSESIDKGTRWASSISNELEGSSIGIVVLTPDNIESRWIHFEAGALAKVVGDAKLAPLLFGLKPSDIGSPLSQFQVTLFTKSDVLKLLKSINTESGDVALPESRLSKMHDALWDDLQASVTPIVANLSSAQTVQSKEPEEENAKILEEILTLVRQSHRMMATDRESALETARSSQEVARILGAQIGAQIGAWPFTADWTDSRIAALKHYWSQGMTASQIADELGGVSRNAVIGKAHRLGLQSRPLTSSPQDSDSKEDHAP